MPMELQTRRQLRLRVRNPGLEVPNPLSIEINRGTADIEVVLSDILGLTKLNFNSCIFADGNPVCRELQLKRRPGSERGRCSVVATGMSQGLRLDAQERRCAEPA